MSATEHEHAARPFTILEQEISAKCEYGGGLSITTRGVSLEVVLLSLIQQIRDGFTKEDCLQLTIRFWQMDEDLEDLELTVGSSEWISEKELASAVAVFQGMIATLRPRFVEALLKHGVVLEGPDGALPIR